MLLNATTKPGEPYDDLEEVYGRLLGQWVLEMNHVAAVIGGVSSQQKTANQEGPRFIPISRERQREAVQFLSTHAFMGSGVNVDTLDASAWVTWCCCLCYIKESGECFVF